MNIRDLLFLEEIMPFEEHRDLGLAVIEQEKARLDLDEAAEKLAAAEALVALKCIQYGVGGV